MLLCIAACGGVDRNQPLRIGTTDELETLDPHRRNAVGSLNMIHQMYESLVTRDRDMRLRPGLAESWENPQENVWRFHLRHEVRFHNGKTLGVEDVAATFRRLRDNPELQMSTFVSHISDVRILDQHRVEITTDRLSLPTLNRFLYVYIIPASYKEYEGKWDSMSCGTGPYRFSAWDGTTLEMKRFEEYWGRKPDFSRVQYFIPQSVDALVREYRAGTLHCTKLEGFPDPVSLPAGHHLKSMESLYVVYMGFNLRVAAAPQASQQWRNQMARAIDLRRIVSTGREARGSPVNQLVSPYVYGFDPSIRVPATPGPPPETPAGPPLRFLSRIMFAPIAHELMRQFGEWKLPVTLEILPDKEFFGRLRAGDMDMYLSRWGCPTADASELFENCFYRVGIRSGFGLTNYSGYGSAELEAEFEQSALLVDPQARLLRLQQLSRKILEDQPWVPLYVSHDVFAVSDRIRWEPRLDSRINASEFSVQD
jgi:peptide/nickel transport system substrate-binding protein